MHEIVPNPDSKLAYKLDALIHSSKRFFNIIVSTLIVFNSNTYVKFISILYNK